jgi:hypothetical protein
MYSPPLLPLDESPVLSTINPLAPVDPALPVRSNNKPLDEAVPDPVIIDTRPPDFEAKEVVPALITISPPGPLLPVPTVTYTAPPRPLDAAPEPMYNAPVLPDPDAPVLKISIPLTPLLTASPVRKTKSPELLPSKFVPVNIVMRPPLVALEPEIEPERSTSSPPLPLLPVPTVT